MKRLRRRIVAASQSPLASQPFLSPNDILEFLIQIPELKGCTISLQDDPSGSLCIVIGENTFVFADTEQTVCM